MSQTQWFDVAVLGAGPAGAAAGRQLTRAGCSVLLLSGPPRRRVDRGETLAGAARPLLQMLGLWDEFAAAGHPSCVEHTSVWGDAVPITRDALQNSFGSGWLVDRTRLEAMLRRDLRVSVSGAPSGWVRTGGHWQLGESAAAGFLLDATGRSGWLPRQLGVQRHSTDRLAAIVAAVPHRSSQTCTGTLVEAVEDGWWYAAPRPDGQWTVVFFSDGDLIAAGGWRDPARWSRRLERTCALRDRLGDVRITDREVLTWLMSRLGAIGQMAFSNYIFHSVVTAFLFTGYGFKLYGSLERYQLYYVVAAIWIFQLIVSPIWLRHYRFGPLEWAWRSLTYWKRQPFRIAASAA